MEIIDLVLKHAELAQEFSIRDLWNTLSYGCVISKSAVKCSVRFLIQHGYIEIRYGKTYLKEHKRGCRGYIRPTPLAYERFRSFRPTTAPL
jgi:hypothetical protein